MAHSASVGSKICLNSWRSAFLHPVCQEELYNPGQDVSINPNENSILTRLSPVPDVVLGYAATGQSTRWDAGRFCVVRAAILPRTQAGSLHPAGWTSNGLGSNL